MADELTVVLEQEQRLSQSILWQLQRNFFAQRGVEAWQKGIVPHYITSNPFIANAYARVVFGFLRDCQAVIASSAQTTFAPLDPNQPVYILELGAGSGRFAYHFLKKFLKIYRGSTLQGLPFKYVMTDIAERTFGYWRSHPSLQPLVAEGYLDFARFEVGQDQELTLRHSGDILSPRSVKNPLIVLANYVFDSVPQDCFYINREQLYESLVTVSAGQKNPNLADPTLLERVKVSYSHHSVTTNYYDTPDLNQLLQAYQHQLNDTTLLFPRAALDCIRHLCYLSGGRLLLLSGDKGYIRQEGLLGWGDQELTIHGSFSMMVNYHAISQYVHNLGGQVLQTAHKHESLNVSAFLLGQHPHGYLETRQAFDQAIDSFGPDDFFTLKQGIQEHSDRLTIPQVLAYLRLSGWDATIFLDCLPVLLKGLDDAAESLRRDIYELTRQVWDTYYHLGEGEDLAFQIGFLLYGMHYYTEALDYFQRSLQLYGPDPSTTYNIGLCHYCLQHLEIALEWMEETLALDPTFKGTIAMRAEIQAKIDQLRRK